MQNCQLLAADRVQAASWSLALHPSPTAQHGLEEIKRNYKKLAKDFHPDKIISKGLP